MHNDLRAKILDDIVAERTRQIAIGYTPEADASTGFQELEVLAVFRVLGTQYVHLTDPFVEPPEECSPLYSRAPTRTRDDMANYESKLIGKNHRERLIEGAALLIAAIEKIDRAKE